jgi:hypothetical protein
MCLDGEIFVWVITLGINAEKDRTVLQQCLSSPLFDARADAEKRLGRIKNTMLSIEISLVL